MFKNLFQSLGKISGGTFLGIPTALMSSVFFGSFALVLGAISIYNTQEIKNKMTGSITYKSDPFSEFIAGLSFLPIRKSWEKLVEQPITSPAISAYKEISDHKSDEQKQPQELISPTPRSTTRPSQDPTTLAEQDDGRGR